MRFYRRSMERFISSLRGVEPCMKSSQHMRIAVFFRISMIYAISIQPRWFWLDLHKVIQVFAWSNTSSTSKIGTIWMSWSRKMDRSSISISHSSSNQGRVAWTSRVLLLRWPKSWSRLWVDSNRITSVNLKPCSFSISLRSSSARMNFYGRWTSSRREASRSAVSMTSTTTPSARRSPRSSRRFLFLNLGEIIRGGSHRQVIRQLENNQIRWLPIQKEQYL
jgi:hypothetical protein